MMGHVVTPETGAKISAAKRGKSPSAETRAKISATLTGRPLSESTVAKLRGRKPSAETNAKRSASLKKALSTPEARERKVQAAKNWNALRKGKKQ